MDADSFASHDEPQTQVSFWGLNLKANGKKDVELGVTTDLILTSVALSGDKKGETTVHVTVNDEKFVLATLSKEHPQYRFDLKFSAADSPVQFGVTGPSDVTFVGAEEELMLEGLEEDDDEEALRAYAGIQGGESDDEDDMEDEEDVPAQKGKPQQGKGQAPHANGQAAKVEQPKKDQTKVDDKKPQQNKGQADKKQDEKKADEKKPQPKKDEKSPSTTPTKPAAAKGTPGNQGNKGGNQGGNKTPGDNKNKRPNTGSEGPSNKKQKSNA